MSSPRRQFLFSAAARAACGGAMKPGEAQETEMLGDHGFEHAVEAIAKLEASFGIDDLAKLTPA